MPVIEEIAVPSVARTWNPLTLIYDGQFHNPDEVDEEIDNILAAVPELVDLEIIGQSYLGRNLSCLRITNEMNTVQKAKTLVVAQHHGREQITVEMALRFILYLLNNYGLNDTITEYVDSQEIFVIPTLNPDALDIVVNEGNHWLRKNLRPFDNDGDGLVSEDDVDDANGDGVISDFLVYLKSSPSDSPAYTDYDWEYWEGIDDDGDGAFNEDEVGLVDLNRNYPTYWGLYDPDLLDPITQVYCGTEPFSEPETQAFRDFAIKHRFSMAYSLHSGINATYFPTDEYGNWFEPPLYYGMLADYGDILPENFNYYLGYTPDSAKRLVTTSGGWGEWMFTERGTTVPITFELYTNGSVDGVEAYPIIYENNTHIIREWRGIYGYFNPTVEHINTLWNEIIPAFIYLLEMTPRLDIAISNVSGGITAGENVSMSVQMTCLSPRLGSKDGIYVLGPDYSVLDFLIAVGGDQTLTDQANIVLQSDLTASGVSITIGNNYTGFTKFRLTLGTANIIDPLLLGGIIGISIAVVALVVYFVRYR
ncbi:MAG: M14 family zinc carboxypeptidase [Promethearchaeota archaeon]